MKKFLGLKGEALNWAIGIIAGCDFLLFGYDQGVMGGILTMPVFYETFPTLNPNAADISLEEKSRRSTYQGISVGSYNLGCFVGSVVTIFVGNYLGRKRMIMLGTSVMVFGAILQASATTIPHFVVGRIITGLGNGVNTSTARPDPSSHEEVPMWQSETSKAHERGKLVMIEGALITCGVMISYWVDLGLSFAPGSVAWRFPLGFQLVFCVIILVAVPWLPESPRWLVLKRRVDEARDVLAALSDTDPSNQQLTNELLAMQETVLEMSSGTFSDLFTMDENRNLHRTLLGYGNQFFQQVSGINLITYYAAVIYSNLGMSDFISRLLAALNGTEYFLASWPAVFLVERVGRRKLMLFGSTGQAVSMAILAGVNSRADSSSMQVAAVVFLFVFNTFFAVGWLGMSWLYPTEVVGLRIRAPASALSTSANWIFNFLIVMITPVAFDSIGYKTYVIFAVVNASIVPCVYFLYPETRYRSLEEMDTIFHKVKGWKGVLDVVKQAEVEPRWYGRNGELLVDYTQTEEHRRHVCQPVGGEEKAVDSQRDG